MDMNQSFSDVAEQVIAAPVRHRGSAPERRIGFRQRTLYRIAHVQTPEDDGLARVVNISDEGIGLKLQLPVRLGDELVVHLSETTAIKGKVVWTHGADCGLQLDDPIDSEALLQELASQAQARHRRPLRLAVDKPALAWTENGLRKVRLRNVSQHGMQIEHDGSFVPGLQVKVALTSGVERRGVVRWSSQGFAGLILLEPFTPTELGSVREL